MFQRLPSIGDKWTAEHADLECWGRLQDPIRGQERRGGLSQRQTRKSSGHQQEGRGKGKSSRWPRFSWESGREIDAEGKQKWS